MVFLGSIGQKGDTSTVSIAVFFIFIAYILHPVVTSAYHRIRAYFAWLAIEDNKFVEVTDYPMVSEVVWGRGKMDIARVIAFALLLFSISSWGLELQLSLVNHKDGKVDMFDRPPPVVFRDGERGSWEVESNSESGLKLEIPEKGTLKNFRPKKDSDEDVILEIGEATSLYRTEAHVGKPLDGLIVTAWWSKNIEDSIDELYYGIPEKDSGHANLAELNCTSEAQQEMYINGTHESWGFVKMCEQGPKRSRGNDDVLPPPTIILNGSDDENTYLIVEEVGSYPGFLYSVWSADQGGIRDVSITHEFHIASRFRLVEAVITGIVFGFREGGKCVDLMIQYSEMHVGYPQTSNKTRTQPFGERPGNNTGVDNLEVVEPIVHGVEANGLAVACLVSLGIMSLVGVIWSLFLRANIGMDIYDRDELIKAVTLTDQGGDGRRPAALRMFVRKDEMGRIDVIISDTGRSEDFCGGFLKKPGVIAQEEPAVATAVVESSDNAIPTGPTQIRLEGMRMGLGRTNFPRGYGPRSYSLTSSPIPSAMCTPMNMTPARGRQREINEVEARTTAEGRKALGEIESVGDSSYTLPTGRLGYTSNLSTLELQGCWTEGPLPPVPSTAHVPRQAGTSSTTFGSTRRLNILRSLSNNMSSALNSTRASSEDSDSDTTFSSVSIG